MLRKFFFLIVTFCSVFLSACGGPYAMFPRHLCKSLKDMSNRINFDIKIPNLVENISKKQYKINYYTTAVPKNNMVVTTGYSITLEYIGTDVKEFKKIELRGIDLSKAGETSENFKRNLYTPVIDETSIIVNERKLFYSAYHTNYTDKISGTKGQSLMLGNSLDYFYVYFMDGNIRYSITFSEFNPPADKKIADVCLKKAESYFMNFDLTKWY